MQLVSLTLIRWIVIYPVDSAIQRLNGNQSLVGKLYNNRFNYPLQKTLNIIIHLGSSTTKNDVINRIRMQFIDILLSL